MPFLLGCEMVPAVLSSAKPERVFFYKKLLTQTSLFNISSGLAVSAKIFRFFNALSALSALCTTASI